MSTRCDNWPGKLALFIEEKRHQPFDWVRNNCCFFACDWLAILTGKDPAAEYRERITSDLSAARVLKEEGGAIGIAEKVCEANRWFKTPLKLARRGDIAALDTPDGQAIGVVIGAMVAFAGTHGVEFRPLSSCRRAWRVG